MNLFETLDPKWLARLEQLSLFTKNRVRGTMMGQRRSNRLGTSLDFADYRLYAPGDDFRMLDWNVYARTGKPFIKQFLDEQELRVTLYIDRSKSMDFGADEFRAIPSKWDYARQLAASIGYIALSGYDRVSVCFFSNQVDRKLPLLRGKGSIFKLLQWLSEEQIQQHGDLQKALMHPLAVPACSGQTWIFSDFLFETGIEETLSYFVAAGQEVVVVHILSPDEIHPSFTGELRLIDSETGTGKEVAMSRNIIKAYESEVQRYIQSLQNICFDRNIAYILATTEHPVPETIIRLFRQSGVVM